MKGVALKFTLDVIRHSMFSPRQRHESVYQKARGSGNRNAQWLGLHSFSGNVTTAVGGPRAFFVAFRTGHRSMEGFSSGSSCLCSVAHLPLEGLLYQIDDVRELVKRLEVNLDVAITPAANVRDIAANLVGIVHFGKRHI